jgi:hypothetical protein
VIFLVSEDSNGMSMLGSDVSIDDPCVKPETNSAVYLLSKTLTHPGYLNIFLMRQAKIIKR